MKRELKRQLAHLSGIFIVILLIYFGKFFTEILTFSILIGFIFLSIYKIKFLRKSKPHFKFFGEIEKSFFEFIDSFDRKEKIPYKGALTFFLSATIVILIFPLEISIISISVLCIYDSFATLIGSYFGKHKIFFNPRKSLEGTFFAFLITFFVIFAFFDLKIAFLSSFFAMLTEILPIRVDDNLTIPFVVGIVLVLLT